ncbi:MAG: transcription antitermination factor NusB [Sphingobacteriales bacterium]|nr:transcription antitermination factor NusB [Sphingobacteriales bacterium]HNY54308.1 transcription antitermination factor NusB [Chitinophagales bacterium]
MITRRSVRIKAMQYIYAYETTASAPASQFQNFLEKSILSVKEQYLYLLLSIREVANFVETDAKIKAGKHIKNEKDKNFNTKLLSNVIIQYLNNDKEFELEVKNAGVASLLDDDNIRQLYKKMTDAKEYNEYLTNGLEFNVEEDRAIVTFLLDNILLEDENFSTNMDELFTNWMDDAEFVIEAVHEVIQKSKNQLKLHLEKGNLKDKFKELTQFGIDLFNETISNKKEHYKIIEPKLKNWETDRLAIIDVILIRMAVSEFLYFPSIPVKVTINEYLDIAKEYSTPKSKDFINGVLDSLMREMKTNDQLNKTGRGLL